MLNVESMSNLFYYLLCNVTKESLKKMEKIGAQEPKVIKNLIYYINFQGYHLNLKI